MGHHLIIEALNHNEFLSVLTTIFSMPATKPFIWVSSREPYAGEVFTFKTFYVDLVTLRLVHFSVDLTSKEDVRELEHRLEKAGFHLFRTHNSARISL